ncbi:transposase, partial [Lactobacillus delbrueckii]|uniref:transposase n=1 Tax=Lactobacillus delbrueckii TaxID=1584 RepID=UPI001E4BC611
TQDVMPNKGVLFFKSSLSDFIQVGDEWMSKVEAVACDMNSDFQEAFKGRYPKLDIVYDRFHIIKNFNDKVVSEIRKDEQRRLAE